MTRELLIVPSVAFALVSACSEPAPKPASKVQEQADAADTNVLTPITKADSIDAGLNVGDRAPLAVSLKTGAGTTTLAQILDKGPAVIVFTRSVEWCPYCQTQLKAINAIVPDLGERGYRLYGLSYDSPEQQERFSQNQMLRYPMLSDEPSAAIDGFGLRDPQYTDGRAVGVPYASVFAIDAAGKIVAKSVSGDFKKRPTNEQILALIDSI